MNIWCIGRNYAEHAQEMGHQPQKTTPLIFAKSADSIAHRTPASTTLEKVIPLPALGEIHYETEIILQLDAKLKPKRWTIGLDLTARQVQAQLKEKGQPWELSKTFKNSAIVGQWIDSELHDFKAVEFSLWRGAHKLQRGSHQEMIFKPEEIIQYIERYFPVRPGDLIFTGTPAGVGPILPHDKLKVQAQIGSETLLEQCFEFAL